MLALLWARPRSLPQGVLVIYFGSAASWRPCNVVCPRQGPTAEAVRGPCAQCNEVALGKTKVVLWCTAVMGRWLEVGWEGSPPNFIAHTDAYHIITAPGHLFFPSFPGPLHGEMPSAARYAAVGVFGRPLPHVVRDAFCEGDEGIAEVREQHRYPPSASAVRECSGNFLR